MHQLFIVVIIIRVFYIPTNYHLKSGQAGFGNMTDGHPANGRLETSDYVPKHGALTLKHLENRLTQLII